MRTNDLQTAYENLLLIANKNGKGVQTLKGKKIGAKKTVAKKVVAKKKTPKKGVK